MVRLTLALVVASISLGCASQSAFRGDGYYNDRYSYRVGYTSPGKLSGSDWILENFQLDADGQPTSPKVGPDYRFMFHADVDGDGTLEPAEELDLVDVGLVHKSSAARIWLSSIPIDQTLAQTELKVLAKGFVEAVSGTGLRVERIGVSKQRSYATRVVDEKAIDIDGLPAHHITFEMASVEQLELDPNSRWQRVSIVLVRPGFFWAPKYPKGPNQLFPVLLIAGYEAQPDRFQANVGDFEAFLRRIAFVAGDLAADAPEIAACAPGKDSLRLLVVANEVVSPDLGDDETLCVRKFLWNKVVSKSTWKSFVLRKKDFAR